MLTFVGFAMLTLTGCTASKTEIGWQTMHAIDVAQTVNGPAQDPCYMEADVTTAYFIGDQPSTESVLIWGAATSAAHFRRRFFRCRYLLPLYFENNPSYQFIEIPLGIGARMYTALVAPIGGQIVGILAGAIAWPVSILIRLWRKTV